MFRRINRIRLEFKEMQERMRLYEWMGINRIRLEFKVEILPEDRERHMVLIESDWNLKNDNNVMIDEIDIGINRIRLEFKVVPDCGRRNERK